MTDEIIKEALSIQRELTIINNSLKEIDEARRRLLSAPLRSDCSLSVSIEGAWVGIPTQLSVNEDFLKVLGIVEKKVLVLKKSLESKYEAL